MCGIAGILGRPGYALAESVLERIAHRGPDGRGRFHSPDGKVSLFHTRLAIQDPTTDGAQPMATSDGQVVIVFNGEIYNFRELRGDLTLRGHQFRSHSDTEVLLALYLEHGTALLERVNGIYAFGIWDARSESLFVARDKLGVKPLYISEVGGTFAFASEIKALLPMPWISRSLDPQALAHYVRYLWCPSPRTPLADIRKLEPGEALVARGGIIKRRWRHYVLPVHRTDAMRSADDWISDVRLGLATAVERQMVSDVPLGAFLSGGLDSSAIVANARRHSTGRLQCFTIDFDGADARKEGFVRDLPYAERVAAFLDVDLHVVRVGASMADQLAAMVWHLDEPQADFAAMNVFLISSLARSCGIKVLLSGAGGDDLFTGYRRHRALGLEGVWGYVPRALRNGVSAAGRLLPVRPPLVRRVSRLMTAAGLEGDERLVSYFDWTAPEFTRDLFVPELASQMTEEPLLQALREMPDNLSSLQRMLLLEQRFFLADHNLNYTDKMSMAAGVEVRVPFLDSELVALASAIPDKYRQRGAQGKWILKRAMGGSLPDEIIYRPKTGFGVPLRAWLAGPLRSLMRDLLGSESIRRRGILRLQAVSDMVRDHEAGRTDHAYSLLSLMCMELWCRHFIDSSSGHIARLAA
jgi:asparagine synthase (glutamine-hydrolysing)